MSVALGKRRYGSRENSSTKNEALSPCRCGHSAKNHRGYEIGLSAEQAPSYLGPCQQTECTCHEYRPAEKKNASVKVGDRVSVLPDLGEGVVHDTGGKDARGQKWYWVQFDDGYRDQYPEGKLLKVNKGLRNAKVVLSKDQRLGSTPQTWSLTRVGTGPGRGEGTGFLSIKEAEDFAAKYGHEIVERK